MSRHTYHCTSDTEYSMSVVVEKNGQVWIGLSTGEIMLSVEDSKALLNQLLEIEKIGE